MIASIETGQLLREHQLSGGVYAGDLPGRDSPEAVWAFEGSRPVVLRGVRYVAMGAEVHAYGRPHRRGAVAPPLPRPRRPPRARRRRGGRPRRRVRDARRQAIRPRRRHRRHALVLRPRASPSSPSPSSRAAGSTVDHRRPRRRPRGRRPHARRLAHVRRQPPPRRPRRPAAAAAPLARRLAAPGRASRASHAHLVARLPESCAVRRERIRKRGLRRKADATLQRRKRSR